MTDAAHARPLNVLVVDDHLSNRIVAESLLRSAGYVAHTVSSGEEALAYLTSEWADVALVDLHLPGLTGFDVTQWIREEANRNLRPAITVLILTADTTERARDEALRIGANGVMTKPLSLANLHELVGGSAHKELDRLADLYLESLRIAIGDESAFRSYLEKALSDLGTGGARLIEGCATGVRAEIDSAAHALKGVSDNLGLTEIAAMCCAIEGGEVEAKSASREVVRLLTGAANAIVERYGLSRTVK